MRNPRGFFREKHAQNLDRGFVVDYKYLGIAYLIELMVVVTSIYGAWLFATMYGKGNQTTMVMMMLAPVAYAGVELARVPLAFALRIQRSKFWKIVFGVMVICAAAVTVKSLSQLGEIMFRPRLTEVVQAQAELKDAKNEQATMASKIKEADAVVAQRVTELATAEERLKAANTELSRLPADRCWKSTRQTPEGVTTTSNQCKPDSRSPVMATNLKDAQNARNLFSQKLDEARTVRAKLELDQADRKVSTLELAFRQAVLGSQLHSFTGMFFGKDPTAVSEGEIHLFLRWFVFFPAIFASLAATALALASVNYLKKTKDREVDIDEDAARSYILEPFAIEIEKRVLKATEMKLASYKRADSEERRANTAGPDAAKTEPAESKEETPRFKVVGVPQ